MGLFATYYGGNSWYIEIEGKKILIDPWLRGPLKFAPGSWFIEGNLLKTWEIPNDVDIVLLTQGLPDHAHKQTLKLLPKDIKVIGSPSAVKVTEELGFKDSSCLSPGESLVITEIEIMATRGAYVPQVENGYIVKSNNKSSIYIEPHGYLDPTIYFPHITAAITPVVDLGITKFIPFVTGRKAVDQIITQLKPKYLLASTTGGEIEFKGLVSKLYTQLGSFDEIVEKYSDKTKVINPEPGKRIELKD
ncbi:MBL fold metallo-hydrolase [Prochlorococcus sp. MIT 1300]|uniref:MBL fold metallo-hydrolase n=1 Tax=Prochlorococcus sp. MIT 1300 TaxID=3096218 RepID=UPI002A74A5D0|nr:MBL fold metallo-hydrolase [Prochlorococcus sp. MIT 1300]